MCSLLPRPLLSLLDTKESFRLFSFFTEAWEVSVMNAGFQGPDVGELGSGTTPFSLSLGQCPGVEISSYLVSSVVTQGLMTG